MKKISLTIILCILIFQISLTAQTTYTLVVSNDNWSNPNVWSPVGIPGPGDFVIIIEKSVTINSSQHTIAGFSLTDGTIYFDGTNPTLTITDTSVWYDGEFDGGNGANGGSNVNSKFIINPGAILIIDTDATTETHRFYEGITVINQGTITCVGSSNIGIRGLSVIQNESLFDMQSDADFGGESFSGGTFLNTPTGIFRKSGGTDVTSFNIWWNFLNEEGSIEGLSGSIHFYNGTFNGGNYFASEDGKVEFPSGNVVIKGHLTGSPVGQVVLSGATMNVDSAGASIDFQGAGFQWSNGAMYVNTTLTIPQGSLIRLVTNPADPEYQYLRGSGTLSNFGTIRQESNDGYGLAGQESTTLDNHALVEVTTDAEFVGPSGLGTGIFINRGLLKKSGGSGVTEIAGRWYIQNEGGTIETQSGIINILGTGFINSGNFVAAANSEIAYQGGTQTLKGILSGSPEGSVRFAGATISIDTSGVELNFQGEGIQWTNGYIYIYTTLTNVAGSLLHLYTDSLDAGWQYLRGGGTFVNLGTIKQESNDGYGLAGHQSTVFDNQGLFDITTDSDFPGSSGSGIGIFHNRGTVRKSNGNGTTLFNSRWDFYNEPGGVIETNSGIIDFEDLRTIDNSTIKGIASINTRSISNNGIVAPGNDIGMLGYVGNFIPSSTGVLDIQLGGLAAGTEYDQLNVTGNANLDGTLKVYVINGFVPSVGDSFVVLTTTGTITDSFQTISAQTGLYVHVNYNSNYIVIVVDSVSLTSVEDITGENIITNYELSQNYPNPFNPSTNIQFAIPQSSFVRLEVFNALGESVGVLVSEELNKGIYNYSWDASGYASGIYIYRISAGDFKVSKKMMLVK